MSPARSSRVHTGQRSDLAGCCDAPPAGFEPAHPVPEGGAVPRADCGSDLRPGGLLGPAVRSAVPRIFRSPDRTGAGRCDRRWRACSAQQGTPDFLLANHADLALYGR
jgi:hypothetical protein